LDVSVEGSQLPENLILAMIVIDINIIAQDGQFGFDCRSSRTEDSTDLEMQYGDGIREVMEGIQRYLEHRARQNAQPGGAENAE